MSEISDSLSEFDLIQRYLVPLASDPTAFSLRDDAAILQVPEGKELVVTKDMLVSGVHFFVDDPPDLIARKALRTNISDLISKGATPYRYSLGLGFPEKPDETFVRSFTSGLREDQAFYDWSLIGGDTTRTQNDFIISVTAYGLCDTGKIRTRLGAKQDDILYVTGTLGNSALGLALRKNHQLAENLSNEGRTFLEQAYLLPEPPRTATELIAEFANASMDISDGLLGDARHIARASQVSVVIDEEAIPLSKTAQRLISTNPEIRETALLGGDDYQCLFSIPPDAQSLLLASADRLGVSLTRIGHIECQGLSELIIIRDGKPSELVSKGHEHF